MSKIIKWENTKSVRAFAQTAGIESFKLVPYKNKEGVSNVGAVFTLGTETVWTPISAKLKETWNTVSGSDVYISDVTNEAGESYKLVHLSGSNGNELL